MYWFNKQNEITFYTFKNSSRKKKAGVNYLILLRFSTWFTKHMYQKKSNNWNSVKISEGFSVFKTMNGYVLTNCAWANKLNNNLKARTNAIAINLAYCSLWLHILVFFRMILLLLRKFWMTKSTKTETVSANVVVCTMIIIVITSSTEIVFAENIIASLFHPICQTCPSVTLTRKELTFTDTPAALMNTYIFGQERKNLCFVVTATN